MEIARIYNEYIDFRKDYLTLVEGIINGDFLASYSEENLVKLKGAVKHFEKLRESVEGLEVSEENENNYKDLNYLLFDALLLSSDLAYFYETKGEERFKMRGVNFLNKLKREEMFGENKNGKCRV